MKFLIESTTTETVDVKVIFPFYRRHDCSDNDYESNYFYKITKDKTLCINLYWQQGVEKWEIEVEKTKIEERVSNLEYALGQGAYACSQQEFEEILERVKKALLI